MKTILQICLVVFALVSCSAKKLFEPNQYQQKRKLVENCKYISEETDDSAHIQRLVGREINDYRYKDDFSRAIATDLDFEDAPRKVIIDSIDIAGDDIYKLPKKKTLKKKQKKNSKIRSKHKSKKHKKSKPHKKKSTTKPAAKIIKASSTVKESSAHKDSGSYKHPVLADAPKNKATTSQNQKYSKVKEQQIKDMHNKSTQIKTPTIKQHESLKAVPQKSVSTSSSKVSIDQKLQELQARHGVAAQNNQVKKKSAANTKKQTAVSASTSSSAASQPSKSRVVSGNADSSSTNKADVSAVSTKAVPKQTSAATGIPPAPKIPDSFSQAPSQTKPIHPSQSMVGKKKISINKDMSLQVKQNSSSKTPASTASSQTSTSTATTTSSNDNTASASSSNVADSSAATSATTVTTALTQKDNGSVNIPVPAPVAPPIK